MLYQGKRELDDDYRKKRAIKDQAADSSLCIFDQPAVETEFPYNSHIFIWNKELQASIWDAAD